MLRRILILIPVLCLLWWILSGHAAPLTLAFGAASAVLVGLTAPNLPPMRLRTVLGFFLYLPWMLGRIVSACLHVARLTLSPLRRLDPKLIETPVKLKNPRARILYAQSITLTPGTISVRLDNAAHTLMIHRLDESSAEDVTGGTLAGRITRWIDPEC